MGDPIPTSPDAQKNVALPRLPDVLITGYQGHPEVVKRYDVTNPQAPYIASPPAAISVVKTILPQK